MKLLPLFAAIGLAVVGSAHALSSWTPAVQTRADGSTGGTAWTTTLVSGTNTLSNPLRLDCGAAVEVYRRSSGTNNTSVTISVGPNTTASATASAVTASTTASHTTLAAGQQCVLWASITGVTGDSPTHTIDVMQPDTVTRYKLQ